MGQRCSNRRAQSDAGVMDESRAFGAVGALPGRFTCHSFHSHAFRLFHVTGTNAPSGLRMLRTYWQGDAESCRRNTCTHCFPGANSANLCHADVQTLLASSRSQVRQRYWDEPTCCCWAGVAWPIAAAATLAHKPHKLWLVSLRRSRDAYPDSEN